MPVVQPSLVVAARPAGSPLAQPGFRALLMAHVCFGVCYSTFLILPKFLATHLHADAGRIGWIMASFGLANVAVAPFVPGVLRRLGPTRALGGAMAVMAVVAFVFAGVETAGPLAFVCRSLQGAAWASMFSAGSRLAVDLAPPDRTGQAIALYTTSNLLTNALGPAVAEPSIAAFGPAPVFVAAGLVAVVGVGLCARIRGGQAAGGTGPTAGTPASSDGHAPLPRFLLLVSAVLGVACGTIFTFHQPLALARGIARVSDFLIAYTLAAAFLRLAFGRLTDRLGSRRVAFASFLLYGVVVAVMPGLKPGGLFLYGAAFGVAHGLFYPAFIATALQATAPAARDRLLASVNATFNGGSIAVAGLGLLAERAGFGLVFVPVGILVVVTALGLRRP